MAQVQIEPKRQQINASNKEDLFNLTVLNNSNFNIEKLTIKATLLDGQFNEVYSAQTISPSIAKNTEKELRSTDGLSIEEHFVDSAFKMAYDTTGTFPPGNYFLHYSTISNDGFELTHPAKVDVIVVTENKNQKKRLISPYGDVSSQSYYQFADVQQPNVPTNYHQVLGTAGVNVLGSIPIGVRFSGLVEDNKINPISTNYAFIFDAAKYRQLLEQKAIDKAKEEAREEEKAFKKLNPSLEKLNRINSILENPSVLKELDELAQLDSIEQQLRDTAWKTISSKGQKLADSLFTDTACIADSLQSELSEKPEEYHEAKARLDSTRKVNQAKMDSLRQRYNELKHLKQKKSYYEELIAHKKDITESLGSIDSLSREYLEKYNQTDFSDPNKASQMVMESEEFSKLEKILYSIDDLQIGQLFPSYSELVLYNTSLKGFSVGLKPGKFGTTYLQGKTIDNDIFSQGRSKKINFASVGYGDSNSEHFHLGFLKGNEGDVFDPEQIADEPLQNTVIFSHGSYKFLDENITVFYEVAGSALSTKKLDFQNSLSAIFSSSSDSSSLNGHAIKAGTSLNLFKDNTNITYAFLSASDDYQSFGAPWLISNNMNELSVSQKLFKNVLQLRALARRRISGQAFDNSTGYTYWHFGGDFTLSIPKWPMLAAGIQPMYQNTPQGEMQGYLINARSNYQYLIGKVRNMLMLMYTQIDHKLSGRQSVQSNSYQINATGTSLLLKGLSLNYSYAYINSDVDTTSLRNHQYTLGATKTLFKTQQVGLGASINKGKDENQSGAYAEWSWAIKNIALIGARCSYNEYQSNIAENTFYGNSNKQWVLQLNTQLRW